MEILPVTDLIPGSCIYCPDKHRGIGRMSQPVIKVRKKVGSKIHSIHQEASNTLSKIMAESRQFTYGQKKDRQKPVFNRSLDVKFFGDTAKKLLAYGNIPN